MRNPDGNDGNLNMNLHVFWYCPKQCGFLNLFDAHAIEFRFVCWGDLEMLCGDFWGRFTRFGSLKDLFLLNFLFQVRIILFGKKILISVPGCRQAKILMVKKQVDILKSMSMEKEKTYKLF